MAQATPPSAALRYLLVYVTDLPRAKAFYIDTLKLQVLFEAEHFLRAGSGDGTFVIGLHQGGAAQVGVVGIELAFQVDDVDQWYTYLASRGVHFTQAPQDEPWGARHANLEDPDGYKLTIFTPLNREGG